MIRSTGKNDGFRFVRGDKPTLKDGVFAYALLDYWERFDENAKSLSFDAVAYFPGSVGKVFLLDENSMMERLNNIEKVTDGLIEWSETAGLKQLIRKQNSEITEDLKLNILQKDF